jgi:hypothetical protein
MFRKGLPGRSGTGFLYFGYGKPQGKYKKWYDFKVLLTVAV